MTKLLINLCAHHIYNLTFYSTRSFIGTTLVHAITKFKNTKHTI